MPNAIDGKDYSKEYRGDDIAGKDALCVQRSAISTGQRVILVDDLVATGGTLLAGVDLVRGLVSRSACMEAMTDGFHRVHESLLHTNGTCSGVGG